MYVLMCSGGAQGDPARHTARERHLHAHVPPRRLDLRLLRPARRVPPAALRQHQHQHHSLRSGRPCRLVYDASSGPVNMERIGQYSGGYDVCAGARVSARRALQIRSPAFFTGVCPFTYTLSWP